MQLILSDIIIGDKTKSALLEYKCPNCGGDLEFDAATQNMLCPYCDSEIDIAGLVQHEQELGFSGQADNMKWDSSENTQWAPGERDSMNVYVCKSCGGEIIADETTGATHCPYCGNPVVMTSKFSGELRPDCVIPFSVTKEQAIAALQKHYEGKKLLPKIFKDKNHLEEIKGVYVPFWLFDANSKADISYEMTTTRTWSDSDYRYTERSVYSGFRQGSVDFLNVPVDGASKMPDDLMESIEPFDAAQAVPFSTAYLSGFMADKYDVDDSSSVERANKRIKSSTEACFKDTVQGYDSVSVKDSCVNLTNSKAKYALYPVWLLTTKFQNKQYLFAVNGQTGKIVGDLPIDGGLVKKYKLLYTLLFGAASYAILLILHLRGMLPW